MGISQVQLDALLAQGLLSTEAHAQLTNKTGGEQDAALKALGKQAEQSQSVSSSAIPGPANNPFNLPTQAPTQSEAVDPFNLSGRQQPAAATPHQASGLLGLTPELMLAKAAADSGQKLTPEQVSSMQEAAKNRDAIPTDQIAGGRTAAAPTAGTAAGPPAPPQSQSALNLPGIGGRGGVGNPFAGPTDDEKYLTPGEKNRKTQIVEGEHLRADILNQGTQLQTKEDQQIAGIRARQANEYKAQIDHDAQVRAKENEIVQKNLNMLTQESKELGQKKIDPSRAWNNLGSSGKIIASIGMFFGSAATRKGGANPAVEQINKAIDRDISSQEFDIKNQAGTIDQRRGLLQDRVRQFGNNELARTAAKKDYLDIVEMNINSVLAGNQSEKTQLKSQDLLASLQEAKDKTMYDFSQLNDQRARQLAAQAAAQAAGFQAKQYENFKAQRDAVLKLYSDGKIISPDGTIPPVGDVINNPQKYDLHDSSGRAANDAAAKDLRERGIALNIDPSTGATLSSPKQLMARTADDAKQIKEGQAQIERLKSNIDQMQALRAKNGGGWLRTRGDNDGAKMSALAADSLLAIKEAEKSGALDEGSVAVIGGMIPSDPTAYGSGVDAQLEQTKSQATRNFASKLSNRLTEVSANNLPASPSALVFKSSKKE